MWSQRPEVLASQERRKKIFEYVIKNCTSSCISDLETYIKKAIDDFPDEDSDTRKIIADFFLHNDIKEIFLKPDELHLRLLKLIEHSNEYTTLVENLFKNIYHGPLQDFFKNLPLQKANILDELNALSREGRNLDDTNSICFGSGEISVNVALNEFFADVVAVVTSKNVNAVGEALLFTDDPELPKYMPQKIINDEKDRCFLRCFSGGNDAQAYPLILKKSLDPHTIFSPTRLKIGPELQRLLDDQNISNKDIIGSTFKGIYNMSKAYTEQDMDLYLRKIRDIEPLYLRVLNRDLFFHLQSAYRELSPQAKL